LAKNKALKILVFALLTSALLMAALYAYTPIAKAQATDTVAVLPTAGGYTTPDAGNYSYSDGSTQTFTATPDDGFAFLSWTVVTPDFQYTDAVDNPISITLNESSYTIQALFTPVELISPATLASSATNAIVVVIAGVGGTTSPAPGTYALANAASLDLTAIPDSGWQFDNWVIAGTPMNGHGGYSFTATPTNNPYNVNHGYGNTYSYEAVFTPISSSTSATPTVNEFSSAGAIIIAAILVLVAFGTYTYARRTKK
jgi:hypothetical protein